MTKLPSKDSIVNHADYDQWVAVMPDELYWSNSNYPYPIYNNPQNIADEQISPRFGSDTCQYCGYVHLTRLWIVKTKDSKYYSVVGSECWKNWSLHHANSKNIIRDVMYAKVRDVFLKRRSVLTTAYWKAWNNDDLRKVRTSAYKFSSILKNLSSETSNKELKELQRSFTHITRGQNIFLFPITDDIIDACKLCMDKTIRDEWEE